MRHVKISILNGETCPLEHVKLISYQRHRFKNLFMNLLSAFYKNHFDV